MTPTPLAQATQQARDTGAKIGSLGPIMKSAICRLVRFFLALRAPWDPATEFFARTPLVLILMRCGLGPYFQDFPVLILRSTHFF
jgi:hypothetical protein